MFRDRRGFARYTRGVLGASKTSRVTGTNGIATTGEGGSGNMGPGADDVDVVEFHLCLTPFVDLHS